MNIITHYTTLENSTAILTQQNPFELKPLLFKSESDISILINNTMGHINAQQLDKQTKRITRRT